MTFRPIGLAALSAALVLAASPARADVAVPDIETIETRLCPVGGTQALRLGFPAAEQDPALRRALSDRAWRIASFTEARGVYTAWSEKLSAAEFDGASPDGDDNTAFLDAMTQRLEAAGWKRPSGKVKSALFMMNPQVFEKTLATADGPRLMELQFDAPGAVLLRCGDRDLLRLGEDELLDQLAPGSPRPVAPIRPEGPLGALRAEDCTRPEIRDNLDRLLDDGDRPDLTGAADHAMAQQTYYRRLNTWLRWKIIASGKADADDLWAIEETVGPVSGAGMESDFGAFADSLVKADRAIKQNDADGRCRALIGVMDAQVKSETSRASRLIKVNAALEAEGRRLGVNLD